MAISEDSASTRHAETCRLAAIMFTDIVGFSRQMGSDEARTLRLLTAHNQIVEQALLERALELGRKAIALDDSMPLAHELVGMGYLWQRQYTQAIAEIERSLALGPSWGSSYAVLGMAFNATGRAAEAISVLQKAIRLNPRDPLFTANYLAVLGGAYRLAGRPDEAIAALKQALSLFRNSLAAHQHLAVIYAELGHDREEQAEVAEILKSNPQYSLTGVRWILPYHDPAEVDRYLTALRKAGLK